MLNNKSAMNDFLPFYFVVVFLVLLIIAIDFRKNKKQAFLKNFISSVLKTVDQAIITVSPDLKIQFANASAEKLFKYGSQELYGKRLDQLFDNYPTIQAPEVSTAINCIDADSRKIPVTVIVKTIYEEGNGFFDGHKQFLGYAYIIKDITEIKSYVKTFEEKVYALDQENIELNKLQQTLEIEKASAAKKVEEKTRTFKEEHARLLASINNLPVGFVMTDQYKNILLFNNSAVNFLPSLRNRPPTIKNLIELEGTDFDLDQEVERSIYEKKPKAITDKLINPHFVKIYVSPIVVNENQQTIGAIIIIKDTTAQRSLEQSKEDLFSIASHELRTPLTAIYGYTSLIKQIYFDELSDPELKNIINNVGVLSKKLSLSINNFLDSSRLEQDRIELKKETGDLYTIVNEAIKETEREALAKNLYIKFETPEPPIIMAGDQARLIQVMTILISNAIKFSQIGGVSISYEIQGDVVKISVADTGSGIPEENRKLIFSKFQQTEENLLTKQEGAGLGLHIAKLLVGKMGGNIWIERTEVNKGSVFAFTIPLAGN